MCSLRDAEFFDIYDDVATVGVSSDGVYSHAEFADRHGIGFPLLSDTDRAVGAAYGAVDEEVDGMSRIHRRSVFLIDPDGTVRFSTAVEADSPDDVDLSPINDVLRDLVGPP